MKRFLLSALFAAVAVTASAQINFGIIGGATFSSANPQDWKANEKTMYHAGATVKFTLPVGFSIQPSVLYQVKGSVIPSPTGDIEGTVDAFKSFDYTAGYLEIPVSLQWGPDLIIMRPYIEVTPFFGYALNNKFKGEDGTVKNNWTALNRWEYGLGVGGGVEVWKFQISARYNWNFGSLFNKDEISDATSFNNKMKEAFSDNNFGGVTLSLAFLF